MKNRGSTLLTIMIPFLFVLMLFVIFFGVKGNAYKEGYASGLAVGKEMNEGKLLLPSESRAYTAVTVLLPYGRGGAADEEMKRFYANPSPSDKLETGGHYIIKGGRPVRIEPQ